MDAEQLEEYRKRMQARYHSQGREEPSPAPLSVSSQPKAAQPIPQPAPRAYEDEDERLARRLQEEEDMRLRDEELARKMQAEGSPNVSSASNVPPPANIQRDERMIDPVYSYPAPPVYPSAQRPLLPQPRGDARAQRGRSNEGSCFPETETCCGVSQQAIILGLAAGITFGIVAVLAVLVYYP